MAPDRLVFTIEYHGQLEDLMRTLAICSVTIEEEGSKDEPVDVSRFVLKTPQQEPLVLERAVAAACLLAAKELGSNTLHGLTGSLRPVPTYDPKLGRLVRLSDKALAAAREQGLDPRISVGIEFDRDSGKGEVFATHPVVPEFSRPFDPVGDYESRRQNLRRPGTGGLSLIEHGEVHRKLTQFGYEHTLIKVEESGGQRKCGFRFWKKTRE